MNRLFFILLFFLPAGYGTAQERLSLSDCIGRALEANYGIRIAVNNEEIDKNNLNYGVFLPSVSAGGSQQESFTDSKRTSNGQDRSFSNAKSDNYAADIQLDWRIFDGLSMFVTHNKLKELVSVGELRTQLAVENLIARISSGYYNILIQQYMLNVMQETLGFSRQRYEIARQKYRIGSLSGLEFRQTRIDLNADSSGLMKQEENLQNAYIELNTLMNGELKRSGYVQDSIFLLAPLSEEETERLMLVQNTSLQIALREKRLSELDLKLARSAFFPTLDFSSGYTYSQARTPAGMSTYNRSNGFFWGFSVNIPLFSRLENNRKIKNARIEVKNQELSYQELELQMRGDLARLFNAYKNNLQLVGFETESAAVARETLNAALERYRLGDLSGIEFRDFQQSYLEAKGRQLTAQYEAKISEISLLLLSGKLRL